MTLPSIALLNTADLAAAAQIAAELGGAQILVFDPAHVDRVQAERIGPVRCIGWPDAPSYHLRDAAAHAEAHALEARLDEIARPHLQRLGADVSIRGWQHLSLYYTLLGLQWHAALFPSRIEAVVEALEGGTCHVPVSDAAQSYYFPSFLPALQLLQALMSRSVPFKAYTIGRGALPNGQIPALRPGCMPSQGDWLLAHLPTCMYDAPHFSAELQAAGRPVVRLQAKFWDVPLEAATTLAPTPADTLAAEQLDADQRDAIEAACQSLEAPLDRWLMRWLNAAHYRSRQAQQLIAVYRAQLVAERLLEQQAGAHPPTRVLLSDHDADCHGPILALARRHRVPVLVLPHSKTSPDLDFSYRDTTVLHHAMQGDAVHDAAGRRLAQFAVEMPTTLRYEAQPEARVRTVGLLLNGTALSGVPVVQFEAYAEGIRQIVAWAAAQGLTLKVRSRPGQTLVRPLVEYGAIEAGPLIEGLRGSMAEFAEQCDLCLMYDAPTSGALELLQRAIPILNPVVTTLTHREAATVDSLLVPRADVAETLRVATRLARDPLEYQRLRRSQFAAFAQRVGQTQALRSFV